MAYNSAYTGSQVDAAVGAVRQKETIWDGKQDELTGTEDQLVGFNSAGEAVAVAKPDPLPTGGETGQVLTKTADGTAWDDVPSDIPAGGTQGQVLTKGDGETVTWSDPASGLPTGGTPGQMLYQGESGPEWGDKPVMYVHITGDDDSGYQADKTAQEIYEAVQNNIFVSALSQTAETSMEIPLYTASSSGGNYYIAFAGMVGGSTKYASITNTGNGEHVYVLVTALPANSVAFTPGSTGLTSDNVQDAIEEVQGNIPTDYVPNTRTINGQALGQNITLDAEDVGAMPPPTRLTVTLNSSSWSGNSQTVTVSGVSADETAQIIMPVPALASQSAYYEAGILVTGQAANSLTFTCSTVPSSNLTVYVVMQEVRA